MTPVKPPARKPRSRQRSKTEDDNIWRAIEALRNDNSVQILAHQKMSIALEDIQKSLNHIIDEIGKTGTDPHGVPIGTGIRGDMMHMSTRIENLYSIKAGWEKYYRAVLLTGGVTFAIVWWFIKDKLGKLFK